MSAMLEPQARFNAETGIEIVEEIAHYPDIPLACDYAAYFKMEAAGCLRIYTVRNPALIGYAIFQVRHSLHYAGSLQAMQDVIYIDPAYRLGRLGMRFLAWCETQLKCEGVQVLMHHVKERHPALGRILKRQGYEVMDVLYTKRLDR
jgi:GNAT superfamily N-acetyltransferase